MARLEKSTNLLRWELDHAVPQAWLSEVAGISWWGCGNAKTQTVVLDPTANAGAGKIVATFAQLSGSDEVWYDKTTHKFFDTGIDANGNRVFDVISDASNPAILESVLLPVSALANPHSIAVDPLTGNVFVPLAGNTSSVGGNTACALGCIAVFAEAVPEPATVWMMFAGLLVMVSLPGLKRRR